MTKTVEGGAQANTAQIEPIAPELEEAEDTVEIVTTARGTFGPQGIAPVGTRATIPLSAFTYSWMLPVNSKGAAKVVAKYGKMPDP